VAGPLGEEGIAGVACWDPEPPDVEVVCGELDDWVGLAEDPPQPASPQPASASATPIVRAADGREPERTRETPARAFMKAIPAGAAANR